MGMPSAATLPGPEWASLYAENLLDSSALTVSGGSFASSTAQTQSGKQGAEPDLRGWNQDHGTYIFDHSGGSYQSIYDELSLVEPQNTTVADITGPAGTSSDTYGPMGQTSDLLSTSFDCSRFENASGPSSNADRPRTNANGHGRRSNTDLDQSDKRYDLASRGLSTSGSTYGLIPVLLDDQLVANCPPDYTDTNLTPNALQCPYPSCTFGARFTRQCDLTKHYRLHFKKYFCRVPNCHPTDGKPRMFALRKDRDRHERTHDPSIPCSYCGKLFSRQDSLRDHCRRRHEELS